MGLRPRLYLGIVGLGLVVALGGATGGLGIGYAIGLAAIVVAMALLGIEALVTRPLAESARRLRRRLHDSGAHTELGAPARLVDELAVLDHAIDIANDEFDQLNRTTLMAHEVIEASSVGVALLDDQGLITEVNPALHTMFRFRANPVGRRPLEVVSSAEVHLVCEEAFEHGESEKPFVTESSDLVAKAHRLSSGLLLRVEDVTAQREAERARNVFVANVSHELRTPLTAILGYLETLLMDEDRVPADLVSMLHTIDRNAKRLRELFDDLLRLHRIEARRRELPMDEAPLKPILEGAVRSARDLARTRNQSFELRCPASITAWVNGDGLSAIISNLALNASAYTTEGGTIEVVVEQGANGIDLRVIDNGMGIDRAHHESIFQRFYRVDEARNRRAGGTGLGLAIVKHYALACGFRIHLDSAPGEGSTFTVHLPNKSTAVVT
ncbi:MAG: ATP-binding protein [Myxococcota bacterium]